MNRTFKVVFNRARAGLMVANEITSSVQKKSTRTVLAIAALCLGVSLAHAGKNVTDAKIVWDEATTPTGSNVIHSEYLNVPGVDENKNNKMPTALFISSGASGTLTDADVLIKANNESHPYPPAVRGVFQKDGGNVVFDGSTASFYAESNHTGSGNSELSAFTNYDGITTFKADKTSFAAKSTYENGKYAVGLEAYGDKGKQNAVFSFEGKIVDINVDSVVDRTTDIKDANRRGGVVGVSATFGRITSKADVFNVTVNSSGTTVAPADQKLNATGEEYESAAPDNKVGAADAWGIESAGSRVDIAGQTNVTVTAKGGKATGLNAKDHFYTSTSGSVDLEGAGIKLENATINVSSEKARAVGIQGTQTVSDAVLVEIKGNAEVNVTSGAVAIGVLQTGGTMKLGSEQSEKVSIKTTATEKDALALAIAVENGGKLTVDGKEISVESNGYGIQVTENSKVAIGTDKTESINIQAADLGLFVSRVTGQEGPQVTMKAKNISVKTDGDFGIHVQNSTEQKEAPENASSLSIAAENLNVTNQGGLGLSAFSNGKLDIDANVQVEAKNAIDVRGNSTVYINKDGNKSTVLKGDIVFETPNSPEDSQNSGKLINAYVNVNLTGKDSSWTGRSYQEYKIDGEYQKLVGLKGDASYHGNVTGFNLTVADGAKWVLTDSSFVNTLTLKAGGIIDATKAAEFNVGTWNEEAGSGFTVSGTGNLLTLGQDTKYSGVISMTDGSELITPLDTAFKDIKKESDVITGGVGRLDIKGPNSGSATLTINDSFTLTTDAFSLFGTAYERVALNLANATLKWDQSGQTIDIPTDVALGAITDKKNVNVNGKKLTISGNGKESSIGTLDFGDNSSAGEFAARNNTIVNVEKLTGNGGVYVGEREGAGAKMFIKELAMDGGHIFVDPYYGHSVLGINALESDTLSTSIIAGDGALVTIGTASEADARAALAKVDGAASAKSVVFMKKAINVDAGGSLYIDPRATEQTEVNAQGVVVNQDGLLAVDQTAVGTSAVFTNASQVKFDGGKLAVVNAAPGTLTMVGTSSAETDSGEQVSASMSGLTTASVLTDNPFVSVAGVSNTAVTLEASASQEGMSTLASMGIQSMIRRADMVLAETIADRMAGEVQTGSNLWVDVRGERYERDNLDNGAGFKADIGYGAFGAELAPTETTTLGVAFQYGNGTVKGDVANVKNKTKDYGFALYGSAMLGDTGVKGIGEVAYTKSTNDITSSLALMNQDTDATMLSAGVKAQKSFDLGTFEVIPSLGVRVSHIKTDAMKAGNVEIEKQKQTIVQIPLALRVNAKATETASGWSVTPKFKVAFIPTVGDKSIEVFGVKQSVIDTSPVQGSFGVGFAKGNLTIDAAAHLGAGNKGTSAVGGKVGLTYRF